MIHQSPPTMNLAQSSKISSMSIRTDFSQVADVEPSGDDRSNSDLNDELSNFGGSARSSTPVSPEYEMLSSEESEMDLDPVSKFEELPTEMIQKIAVELSTDIDLSNLSMTCTTFADVLNPDEADIWRKRFLARYDHPIGLEGPEDYAIAYKLRRFVLRGLDGEALRNAESVKSLHQLLVILDMVLETYASSGTHLPPSKRSKNLSAMSSPGTSRWIVEFLGCALFGNLKAKYGKPDKLFDTLQVTLSHLVLHQRSPVMVNLTSSRENYDLTRVYNYNMPFNTIFEESFLPSLPKTTRFPGLARTKPKRFNVNMHTLLHIRNFWQRHFSHDNESTAAQGTGENTYTSMARNLVTLDKIPRKWDFPLQTPLPAHLNWIGHYSCLHPWPKSRESLEEQQSCAEDWDKIDPMTIELESSSENTNHAFWPPLFSSIPIFENLFPVYNRRRELNLTYIRGISSFLDVHRRKSTLKNTEDTSDGVPKWHPFLASRVHGFIHDIEPQDVIGRRLRKDPFSKADNKLEQVIPGWKHIVMVIYKPPKRHLLTTIEYAQEDYGGSTGVLNDFNTANIWNDDNGSANAIIQTPSVAPTNASTAQGNDTQSPNDGEDPNGVSEEEIDASLEKEIYERIDTFSKTYSGLVAEQQRPMPPLPPFLSFAAGKATPKSTLPPLFSMKHILAMDEALTPAQYKDWDNTDYAYAYEGVIVPGGKIMLGRWWRIGANGMGRGKEIGPDGVGVEVRPVVQTTPGPSTGSAENESERAKSCKRKKKAQGTRKSKRVRTKAKGKASRKSSLYVVTSGDDEKGHEDDINMDSEDERQDEKQPDEMEKGVEYEFVTMLNGQESRAINATKGLERGPFVFWAD